MPDTFKSKGVKIRPAKESDANAIIEYIKENQDSYLYMISKTSEMDLDPEHEKKMIRLHAKRQNCLFLIAIKGDKVLGISNFVGGNRSRDCHDGEFGLSVHKAHFGEGIGSRLLEALMLWGKRNKVIKRMTLFVMNSNIRAINLYRKYGFKIEGVRKDAVRFEDGRVQDLIMMGILKREGSDEWNADRQ